MPFPCAQNFHKLLHLKIFFLMNQSDIKGETTTISKWENSVQITKELF